jgi:putative pyruvate formate lyase activating enzyme
MTDCANSGQMSASYTYLSEGEWRKRLDALAERERACVLCPRDCGCDRLEKLGICKAPRGLNIASTNLHWGEEPPITGSGGSGTIFVAHCNLKCAFCQNFPISHFGNGRPMSDEDVSDAMLKLQKRGAHNINFVSPTHYSAALIRAVYLAAQKGLTIPLVWNSNGYESVDTLRLLEGIVDIYLPDIKYSDNTNAKRYSAAPRYWEIATAAVKEMRRQVGDLKVDEDGIAWRGLLIRHLVLPGDRSGTRKVLEFIAQELGLETHLSLMVQYFPTHRAMEMEGMSRPITAEEYEQALQWLDELGLENGYTQEDDSRFC